MKHFLTVVGAALALLLTTSGFSVALSDSHSATAPMKMEVWKTPTCGCCKAWVSYLEERGVEVVVHDLPDVTDIKMRLGLIDRRLHSCHTAKIGDYVIEGHVPIDDIKRVLKEKPPIVGLTAPGMPMYSPGMASIVPKDYDVLSFDKEQTTKVFSSY